MKSTADVSLGLIPSHETGLAGSEPLFSLAQNVFVPGGGLEAIRIAAQVLPEASIAWSFSSIVISLSGRVKGMKRS